MGSDAIEETVLVEQLPSNSWFEGFEIRPNGHGIASRSDAAEIYTYDADHPEAELKLVHTFPDATGCIHLCPIEGVPDEYMVMSALVNMSKGHFEDFVIWRLKFTATADGEKPVVTRVATIPEAGFCIGMLSVSENTLLIADSAKNCIWTLDIPTGAASVLLTHDSMAVGNEHDFYGLNHIRLGGGYIWYTNSSKGVLGRFPVETGAEGIRVMGPVEIVTEDIKDCDGLALNKDFTAAYTAIYMDGLLAKITIDPATGKGEPSLLVENLVTPTCVELVYVDDKPKIYAVCCGQIQQDWINRDESSWSDIAALSEAVAVSVVVTEDVVETA
ncbi:hypothetical protein GQ53DRAFT_170105 [Thozetella sp. PMI_491]|nr:hypothetical protein GQ53DRAFT_170105 [Thozetella sp. PMI_491]